MDPRTDGEDDSWLDEDAEDSDDYLEDDMEDDVFSEEFDGPEDEDELDFDPEWRPKTFTARQRIEMAREEKWLQSLVADFDDFDRLDGFNDEYVGGLSH